MLRGGGVHISYSVTFVTDTLMESLVSVYIDPAMKDFSPLVTVTVFLRLVRGGGSVSGMQAQVLYQVYCIVKYK